MFEWSSTDFARIGPKKKTTKQQKPIITNKYLHDKRVLELLWLKDNIIIITIHAVLNTVWNKSMFNTHIHLI